MRTKFINTFCAVVLLVLLTGCNPEKELGLQSPSGNINLRVELNDIGEVFYSLQVNKKELVSTSKLGFDLMDNPEFSKGYTIEGKELKGENSEWKPVWGTDKLITNNFNQLKVNLKNEQGYLLNLYFKLYDDGLGFRYEIPRQQKVDSLFIKNELTEFNFTQGATAWSIPASYESYELVYRTSRLDEVKDANTPITFKTDLGLHVSIHEANLTDFAGMTVVNSGGNHFKSNLVPWPDGIKVKTKAPMLSPWRTLTITKDAAGLVESNLVLNLNEPNKIEDTSWIKPMKYIGIWWGMHLGVQTWTMGPRHGATTENMKAYIDFASDKKVDAVLTEGWNTGWENWGKPEAFDQTTPYADFDFDEIVRYSKEKGVELMGHHETGGDIFTYEARLDTAMKMLSYNGIRTLKTGYAGGVPGGYFHHSQRMVQHYRLVVEKAAKYQLMINAHEPIKATGIRRTWPNMMTREGARGMEWNAWSEGNSPEHYVIVPFTRCLGGPLDYTPGTFDILYENRKEYVKWNGNDKGNSRVNTTLAKQLALWVTLYSPLQMASDMIENYEGHNAFNFFENLPSDWEESKVLAAEIGDYFIVARRSGKNWYIGATTDENERTLNVDLSFLKPNKKYKAIIYADNEETDLINNPTSYSIYEKEVNNDMLLEIAMVAGGGQAIEIVEL